MRPEYLLFLVLAGSALADPVVPRFEPVPVAEHVYDGGWEHFVGGGVAVFDCDGDRLPDLYSAGGSNPAQLFRNATGKPGGKLRFEADTPDALSVTGVTGAYPLDIDGDSKTDLAILRVGPDLLLKGLGDCRFEPFSGIGFESGDHWTTAFSATWEKGESLPTLAFGTYVDRSNPEGPFEACDDTLLYRPDGERYLPPQRLSPGYCALSLLFSDWNRDGRADLRVSNDRHYYVRGGEEQLWAMEKEPRLFSRREGWQRYSLWGMGIASRDMNGDGYSDVYLTSMGDQKFQMFDPGAGGPVWRDVTYERGTTAHRPHAGGDGRPSTGWHAEFADVNNDGLDDIFVAKGNVEQMPDAAMKDPNSLLLQNADGTFTEVSVEAGIASMDRSRGGSLADLDLDGAPDLVVINRRAPMEVFRNTGTGGNWLLVDLTGGAPNTSAVGSFLEVRAGDQLHTREVAIGGGHAGGSKGLHHFGLGEAASAEIRVIRPDGTVSGWQRVEANRIVEIGNQ